VNCSNSACLTPNSPRASAVELAKFSKPSFSPSIFLLKVSSLASKRASLAVPRPKLRAFPIRGIERTAFSAKPTAVWRALLGLVASVTPVLRANLAPALAPSFKPW
jgi:hypothetical protein